MKYNIPKLARNQYNYVKGLDGEKYVTQSQMMMATGGSGGSINSNTFSQNDQLQSAIKANCDTVQDACYTYAYLIQQQVENDINDTSASAYSKAEDTANEAKNSSYAYTNTQVSDLKLTIENQLSTFAWPTTIVTSNYTVAAMNVGEMRPVFINSSSTIDLTMPGDSTQQYVILAVNVMVSALVAAGKIPRYIAAAGGSSTSMTWTSSAEPYMLVLVLRLS